MVIMKMMEGTDDLELSEASETRLGPGIHGHIDKQFLLDARKGENIRNYNFACSFVWV
jgi:hypothetical protein